MSKEEELSDLALMCFDGDPDKAIALLKLIKLSLSNGLEVESTMDVECRWLKNGQCWLNMPDSLRPCKIPCNCIEKHV